MLTLTNQVVDVITAAVGVWKLPEGAGLRIATSPATPNVFEAAMVDEPDENDTVVEVVGARVYLDSVTQRVLDDKVLDVQVLAEGGVTFTAVAQAEYARLID